MTAWTRDIYVEQGATFPMGFVVHELTLDNDGEVVKDADGNPVPGPARDLSGCTARMQIRRKVNAEDVLVEATSLDLDDDPDSGQRIVVESGGVTGRIDVQLTDLDTDKLNVTKGVYDLEIVYPQQPGELRPFTERVLQGNVTISLNVTRDGA